MAFDLPGHGSSPPLPPDADSHLLARDVLTSAAALGLTTPLRLVGHSLGGRVALRAAQREPAGGRLRHAARHRAGARSRRAARSRACSTCCCARPTPWPAAPPARARLVGDGLSPALADWLLLNLEAADGGFRWKIDRRALAALHARVAAEDLWPAVESARGYAVQCVRGGASGYVSDADTRRLASRGLPRRDDRRRRALSARRAAGGGCRGRAGVARLTTFVSGVGQAGQGRLRRSLKYRVLALPERFLLFLPAMPRYARTILIALTASIATFALTVYGARVSPAEAPPRDGSRRRSPPRASSCCCPTVGSRSPMRGLAACTAGTGSAGRKATRARPRVRLHASHGLTRLAGV